MVIEHRKMERRNSSYYIPVADADSSKQIGIITDISLRGFKLDSQKPIPNGQVSHFRLGLTTEIAPRAFLEFSGRSRWCRPDDIEPSIYNVGFEIFNMPPGDALVYQRVFEKYGSPTIAIGNNNGNYLWK